MKKIMAVISTKPEVIKISPLLKVLKTKKDFEVMTCITDQFKDLTEPVLDLFEIKADYILAIDKEKLNLYDIISSILTQLKTVFKNENPELVLVQGDSITSFVTALLCYYMQIPLGHVEAGLRTYDTSSPFPEEFNRQAIGILAQYNFVSTRRAKLNLIKEGKNPATIFITGNTTVDSLKTTIKLNYTNPHLKWAEDSRLIIVATNKATKLGEAFKNICKAVKRIAEEGENVKVIFLIDLDSALKELTESIMGSHENVLIIDPLPVKDFHNFMNHAYVILTDSAGIQEEAPALGVPVLVISNSNERPEGVKAGTLKMVGTNEDDIVRNCKWLLNETILYQKMSKAFNPYGDGYASERIADIIQTGRRWEWNEHSINHLDFNRKR